MKTLSVFLYNARTVHFRSLSCYIECIYLEVLVSKHEPRKRIHEPSLHYTFTETNSFWVHPHLSCSARMNVACVEC